MKKVVFAGLWLLVLISGVLPAEAAQETISSFPSYLEGVTPRGGPTWTRMFQMLLKKETAVFSYPHSVAASVTITIPATPSYVIITSDGVATPANTITIQTASATEGQMMFVVNEDSTTTAGDVIIPQNNVALLMYANAGWRTISVGGAGGGVTPIALGGTGQTASSAALTALGGATKIEHDAHVASTGTAVHGLGTAAIKNTGTSGNTVPLLDGLNTWNAQQALNASLTDNLVLNNYQISGDGDDEGIAVNAAGEVLIATITDNGAFKHQVAGDALVYGTGSTTIHRVTNASTTGTAYHQMVNDAGSEGGTWKQGSADTSYGGVDSVVLYNANGKPIAVFQGTNCRWIINTSGEMIIGTSTQDMGAFPFQVWGDFIASQTQSAFLASDTTLGSTSTIVTGAGTFTFKDGLFTDWTP